MNTKEIRKFSATVNKRWKEFRKGLDKQSKAKELVSKALNGYSPDGNHSVSFDKNMKLAKKLAEDESLTEGDKPYVGGRTRTIHGKSAGRIQNIDTDENGKEVVVIKSDDGRIITTPTSNIQMEQLLKKVRSILKEAELLREYNEEKNWSTFGDKIKKRMEDEGITDNHREKFHQAVLGGDPTKNKEYGRWIAQNYASGGINKIEDIGARLTPALERYHEHKKRGTLKNHGVEADALRIKGLDSMVAASRSLPKPEATQNEVKKAAGNSAMRHLVGENEHWQHFQMSKDNEPTHEESRHLAHHYAGGTGGDDSHPGYCEWCTAQNGDQSKETMKHYLGDGDLHVMIPKKPKHEGERYQIHHESNQQMDEKDRQMDVQGVYKERPYPESYQHVLNKHLDSIFG